MQTRIPEDVRATPQGREADAILRRCTHCGFCLATCPTYRLLGDELDGPRGRIYQIKQVFEGAQPTAAIQLHLDRCLTCRACETTCPSGVEYARLADLGRARIEAQVARPLPSRIARGLLRRVLPRRRTFAALLGLGRMLRPVLPQTLRRHIPPRRRDSRPTPTCAAAGQQHLVLVKGCVQPALAPSIDEATLRLFRGLGFRIETTSADCCGAIDQHLGFPQTAARRMRRNVRAWSPLLSAGATALVSSASGCAVQLRGYGHALRDDTGCAQEAQQVASAVCDPVEILDRFRARLRPARGVPQRIAFQAPCTLQHGLGLQGRVERLLEAIGFELTPVAEAHSCCGSAGTYSLLQAELSSRLRADKLEQLQRGRPDLIATANIGCLIHLGAASTVPVRHWLELIETVPATHAREAGAAAKPAPARDGASQRTPKL